MVQPNISHPAGYSDRSPYRIHAQPRFESYPAGVAPEARVRRALRCLRADGFRWREGRTAAEVTREVAGQETTPLE